ncbi:MAG: PolC-type DNA polymerase III [Fastidiosipilaceae bacterium]|jgi:DNA polymerase-3 subunit alpha (Gram-positive type)
MSPSNATFLDFINLHSSSSPATGIDEAKRAVLSSPTLNQAEVSGIHVSAHGQLEIELLLDATLSAVDLNVIERSLAEQVGARQVRFFLRYRTRPGHPARAALELMPWLIEEWSADHGFIATLLKQADFRCQTDSTDGVDIHLPNVVIASITDNVLNDMSLFMKTRADLSIYFSLCETKSFDTRDTARRQEAAALARISAQTLRAPRTRPAPTRDTPKETRKRTAERPHYKRKSDVLYGRINKNLSTSNMERLNLDSGLVHIVGQVVNFESKSISDGQKALLKFDLFGEDGAIACRMFLRPEQAEPLTETLREEPWCGLDGDVSYNSYDRDLTCMVRGIELIKEPPKRHDLATEKRVELHAHTKMSSQDAICSVDDLVRLAASFGHEAIAITDHGVVQSFPEAYETVSRLNKDGNPIKLIYGMEGYLVDDGRPAVYGIEPGASLNEFVALDLETTGLDSAQERIIEVGAIRYKLNNKGEFEESETFYSFVDPEKELSQEVHELTGIHSFDLQGAPKCFPVMEQLKAFIGDAPIIGHNILFDLGFLRYAGFDTPRPNDPRIHFNPTAVDTLALARHCLKNQKSYRLGDLAAALELETGELHRAVDDARLAARLFLKMWELLERPELSELNKQLGCMEATELTKRKTPVYHIIFLVNDEVGLYHLYRLVSESHIKYFNHRPRIPKSLLTYLRDGLTVGSACEAGQVFCAVKELYTKCGGDYELARKQLRDWKIRFLARYYDYLEIQPLTNNKYLLDLADNQIDDQTDLENLNRLVVELGEINGQKVVATCDTHFLNKEDKVFRGIMQTNMGYADADNQSNLYFRNTDEMLSEFSYLGPEKAHQIVIEHTHAIASRIKPGLRPFPAGSFPPLINTAADDVRELTWATARSLYEKDGELPAIVRRRIEKELSSIIDNGFAVMYFISAKLVNQSMSDGYIVGSRGSVGSSFVATLCHITEVNPLIPHYRCPECKHSEFFDDGVYGSGYDLPAKDCPYCGTPLLRDGQDIPFETFLGFEGDKQPDIDLNFSSEYQPRAHQYVVEMFGAEHTFRAGTIGSYAEKNAEGLVRGWLEKHDQTANRARVRQLASGLNGVKRTTGQHPGGIVVIPKEREIYDFTPVQYPANDVNASMTTTHFDFKAMQETILKLDILGHMDPTMLKMLGDLTGEEIANIPIPDDKVMALFQSVEPLGITPGSTTTDSGTLGLPELGTPMARDMINETTPGSFYNLVQLMGLSHGTDVWKGNAQELIRDGVCTIDEVIGCRDGIMTSLIHWGLPSKASFDIMEKVRKGKNLSEEQLNLMREHHVPEWYIDSCEKIKYMFPKAHAAAYSISSLRVAWFKVYHPEAFYASYFTVRAAGSFDSTIMCGSKQDVLKQLRRLTESVKRFDATEKEKKSLELLELIEEMLARGIRFLPVDINLSQGSRFTVEGKGKIRPSLDSIPGISAAMGEKIVAEREAGAPFKNQEEAGGRCGLGPSSMASLRECGAFGELPESAQLDLFSLM